MRHYLYALIAALALALTITAPAGASGSPFPQHPRPQVPAPRGTHSTRNFGIVSGFFNDGAGVGSAASPVPLKTPDAGDAIYSIGDTNGAWRMNVNADTSCSSGGVVTSSCPFSGNAAWENGVLKGKILSQLQVKGTSLCLKDSSNHVVMGSCDNSRPEEWVINGYYFYNVSATDANSFGNPQPLSNPVAGGQLITCDVGCESVYHQEWTVP